MSDADNLGSEQDSFAVPWNLDKSQYVDVKVEKVTHYNHPLQPKPYSSQPKPVQLLY